jgi:hypothetical protein
MSVEPIRRPTAWRLATAAFAIWAMNFLVGYAAALIVPEHVLTKLLLVGLALASIPALLWIDRQSWGMAEKRMVRVATALSALAILFNGIVAIA